MYLIPSHPSFLVFTVFYRQSFLVLILFLFMKPFSPLLLFLSPLLLFLANPVFLSISSHQTFFLSLYLLLLLTNPISLFFSFLMIISLSSFPSRQSFLALLFPDHPSFLVLLLILIRPFSLFFSYLQILSLSLFLLTAVLSLYSICFPQCSCISITPPTCPYLAAACRRLLSPSPA
jgi:hypothetical protein